MGAGIWAAIRKYGPTAVKFSRAVTVNMDNPRNRKEMEALAPIIDAFHEEGVGVESPAFVMLLRRFAGVHAADVYKDWTLGSIVSDEMSAGSLIPHEYLPTVVKYTAQVKTLQNQNKKEKAAPEVARQAK